MIFLVAGPLFGRSNLSERGPAAGKQTWIEVRSSVIQPCNDSKQWKASREMGPHSKHHQEKCVSWMEPGVRVFS